MRFSIIGAVAFLAACGTDSTSRPDAAPRPDAADIDAGPGLGCSMDYCELGEGCCIEQINPPRVSFFCVPDIEDICGGDLFLCDGPEDCAEDAFCCGANASTCELDGCEGSIVCHTIDDCPPPFSRCAATPLGIVKICR